MPNPASPSPASPVSMELPEEIERAIECLIGEAMYEGGRHSRSDGQAIQTCRSALTTAILSLLTAAEAEREEERSRYGAWADEIKVVLAQVNDERSAALARVERLEKALQDAASDFDGIANSADPFDDAVGTQDHGLLLAIEKMAGSAGEKVRSALSEAPSQGDQ